MKLTCLMVAATLTASVSLLAADATPKDDVLAAAKKLGDAANYSWHATVEVPESSPFKPGPTDGKTEKGSFTELTLRFGDNTTHALTKGDKFAATNPDGDWQSAADMENAEGPARFMGGMLRNYKTPAAQAEELAGFAKDLKKDGDAYSGDLTEQGAKTLLTFRRRAGGEGPSIANPKGNVKFWLKDGALVKYVFNVKGTMSFNGNDFDQDRTTTVEIKAVGTTKIEVPDAAKKKLGA